MVIPHCSGTGLTTTLNVSTSNSARYVLSCVTVMILSARPSLSSHLINLQCSLGIAFITTESPSGKTPPPDTVPYPEYSGLTPTIILCVICVRSNVAIKFISSSTTTSRCESVIPSCHWLNIKPSFATAPMEAISPGLYSPPPVTVPPPSGLANTRTMNLVTGCRLIRILEPITSLTNAER